MKAADLDRMVALEAKEMTPAGLTARERQRLTRLQELLAIQQEGEKPCPFRTHTAHPVCTKKGGVCSLRLYTDVDENGQAVFEEVYDGDRGRVRAICPFRFHQDSTVFHHIGETLMGDPTPLQAGEVGFLESTGNLDSPPGEDVGRIDMILVADNNPAGHPMEWAAVEIQAVYFSGKEMAIEFRHIVDQGGIPGMPVESRRLDYRSSGPKRLMPQFQIKVPTLRRWGKKMAAVVDVAFFRSMGEMRRVNDLSNADIVWFLVDFVRVHGDEHLKLVVVDHFATTLENAIEGLTGGTAVSKGTFEERIRNKTGIP